MTMAVEELGRMAAETFGAHSANALAEEEADKGILEGEGGIKLRKGKI